MYIEITNRAFSLNIPNRQYFLPFGCFDLEPKSPYAWCWSCVHQHSTTHENFNYTDLDHSLEPPP